ncbi:MAG: cobalamin B12-binding domain-containing protein [Archaeoglobales archaeon]|jgi:methylmalonyl-CoA mutase C-terminal domain/subunit|nr:cobalamin B12-binding domain-containing protein [Archaeoglobi archaeon]NHW23811.1 cobalamin B12-binding domain-containing protein [Archaeoglobales archaeon]TDA26886.1 MAG: methylmalonyl-CoA mutase [Archaeoglobi archaeon]TDA30223.1 MAG: methylmalonyl-CoA mutase [Archaeoglobi archaeon]
MEKIRVLIAKLGLDGHDRGAKIIARFLRDAGFEVIYTGLHRTPQEVARAVIDEDVDVLGISILSGAHIPLVPRVLDFITQYGGDPNEIVVVVGGTIPTEDIPKLKACGVDAVFIPGTPISEIIKFIKQKVAEKRRDNL